jgi:O-acetyl-ADP-ribose deacetylase (regulator of RNase III)
VVTSAGNLSARYIFHAVGPIYGHHEQPAELLQSAYQKCLELAEQYHLRSIAFPSLSTGAYRYPLPEAATIALRTIVAHLQQPTSLKEVTIVLFDRHAYEVYERVLSQLL